MDINENCLAIAINQYNTIRQQTEIICAPLEIEDYVIQGIEDVSPAKWHLAHTTWFFETMILVPQIKNYQIYNPLYHALFNSYYQTLGQPYPRPHRGVLSRPTVKMIYAYRHYIDEHVCAFLQQCSPASFETISAVFSLGLQHEQQHQELLLMDIKFNFSLNLDYPHYHSCAENPTTAAFIPEHFITIEECLAEIGHTGDAFSYDNERPRHKYFIQTYALANRLTTNGEYLAFIQDKGYQSPALWLAEGWDWISQHQWQAPLYWHKRDQQWYHYTLHGLTPIHWNEPVSHISFYEADAYARWRGKRLATEMEWEYFVHRHQLSSQSGNFLENQHFHPLPANAISEKPQQFFGDLWEWTMSPYSPYPGYQAYMGSLSEYNGKFMCNQMVLRGGSCVTPHSHIRASYRNFFQADKRWQFSGIRLAETPSGT